jgi:hypothetical protein
VAALFRHKTHAAQAFVKAAGRREEDLGDSLLDDIRQVQPKAWELLAKMEAEGDLRGSIVALREVRECRVPGEMLSRAETSRPTIEVSIVSLEHDTGF